MNVALKNLDWSKIMQTTYSFIYQEIRKSDSPYNSFKFFRKGRSRKACDFLKIIDEELMVYLTRSGNSNIVSMVSVSTEKFLKSNRTPRDIVWNELRGEKKEMWKPLLGIFLRTETNTANRPACLITRFLQSFKNQSPCQKCFTKNGMTELLRFAAEQ